MWKAPVISLRPCPKEILEQLVRSRSARSDQRQRAQLILLFNEGLSNTQAAQRVGLKRRQAGHWRRRWLEAQQKLVAIEEAKPNELARGIKEVLGDLPRSGARPTFSAEQIARILTVACEEPLESGLPLSHWTLETLKQEVIKRHIVERISTSRLQVFLKSGRIKAPQSRAMDSHTQGSGRL